MRAGGLVSLPGLFLKHEKQCLILRWGTVWNDGGWMNGQMDTLNYLILTTN